MRNVIRRAALDSRTAVTVPARRKIRSADRTEMSNLRRMIGRVMPDWEK